jgi:hypothetical protein
VTAWFHHLTEEMWAAHAPAAPADVGREDEEPLAGADEDCEALHGYASETVSLS